jgi:hypothetical protein
MTCSTTTTTARFRRCLEQEGPTSILDCTLFRILVLGFELSHNFSYVAVT